MWVGSFSCSNRRLREPFFSRGGLVVESVRERRLKRAGGLLACMRPAQLPGPGALRHVCGNSGACVIRLPIVFAPPRPVPRRAPKPTAASIDIRSYPGSRRRARARAVRRPGRRRARRVPGYHAKDCQCVMEIPFSINCLWRRLARSSGLAVTNTLRRASGKTTVPMSRPSATSPGSRRKARCRSRSAARTRGERRDPRGGGAHRLARGSPR